MNDLDQAIKIVKQGGIVIFPTDTAYGIGCRIDSDKSVEKLYEIRKRPKEKAMPVLFDSISRVKEYLLPFDVRAEALMDKYWPGALTIILPCRLNSVPSVVRGGGDTLGVRIPDHDLVLGLITGANVPIIGSSANFSGEKTPFTFSGLDKRLIKLVDFVLEGKTWGKEKTSTVIDCSRDPWEIIRQGEVMPDL